MWKTCETGRNIRNNRVGEQAKMKKIRNTAGKNKEKRYGVMAALLSAGLVLGMTVEPLSVQAAGSGVLPTA